MIFTIAALLAAAPAPAVDADARCLVAFSLIGGSDSSAAELKESSKIGVIYFAGKLKGHDAGANLEAAMRAGITAVQPQLEAEITRCAAELAAMGDEMTAAGTALQKTP